MEYLMFIVNNTPEQDTPTGEELTALREWLDFVEERGARVRGDRLRPPEDATLVRRRGGELLVTDGPFAETTEWIGGFDILDVDSLEEAVEIASRHPAASDGRIEVRPAWPFDENAE